MLWLPVGKVLMDGLYFKKSETRFMSNFPRLFCDHGQITASECVVPEKIHTHSMEGHWKFLGGGGLKSQNFRSKV